MYIHAQFNPRDKIIQCCTREYVTNTPQNNSPFKNCLKI